MTNKKINIRVLSPKIRAACLNDEFYHLLLHWKCGAFDGACLMVAIALQNILGGDLYAILGLADRRCKIPRYQHVLVRLGNLYIDGYGVASKQLVISRWLNSELLEVHDVVPLLDPQKMVKRGTPACEQTIKKLTQYFRTSLEL